MERNYKLIYWVGPVKHFFIACFKSKNDAYLFIYEIGGLPISVDYIGWK